MLEISAISCSTLYPIEKYQRYIQGEEDRVIIRDIINSHL